MEDVLHQIRERGQDLYIPLGKIATATEERNDANLDSASSSEASMTPANTDDEGETGGEVIEDEDEDDADDDNNEEEDLDGDMQDDDMDVFDDRGPFAVDPRDMPSPPL